MEYEMPSLYKTTPFYDKRGILRKYNKPSFDIKECYIVDNNPKTFRGLHLQNRNNPQAKLVSCFCGQVEDYVLDTREGSPTFLFITVFCLSDPDEFLYIPAGYAHGYFSPAHSKLLYLMDSVFDAGCYATINVDSIESIHLPSDAILSDKDATARSRVNYKERRICW